MARDWLEVDGLEETQAGLRSLAEFLTDIHAGQQLSDRSQTIAAVHRVFDDAEAAFDADGESTITEAIQHAMGTEADVSKLNVNGAAAKSAYAKRLTERATEVEVAIIEARDLIDTGLFLEDVKTAAWIIED